ncbi:YadA-like family protein, partial [Psychrobacter celer]|uniref:YadA-like family protein n=1 Tax=Psychrobacter celer TaxID=306572 RepID=UPI003FD19859
NKAAIEGKLDTVVGGQSAKNATQDGLIGDNAEAITANKAEVDSKISATNGRIDDTNQTIQDNWLTQMQINSDQDRVIAANKADADGKIDATNQTIQNNLTAQAQTDANQDQVVAANKADADSKITAANDRITAENAAQDQVIANNDIVIHDKVDAAVGVLNAKNLTQDQIIESNKADADSKITATNDRITTETSRLDAKNTAQDETIASNDALINNKVDTAVGELSAKNAEQDAAIDRKADLSYVYAQNNEMDNRISSMMTEQMTTDTAQDAMISRNTDNINKLGYKVNELDKNLSGGVASTIALAFMPSSGAPGSQMITGGSGHYNGQSAVSLGFSGTTVDSSVTYKIGVAWATSGENSFGAGLGYRFK